MAEKWGWDIASKLSKITQFVWGPFSSFVFSFNPLIIRVNIVECVSVNKRLFFYSF